MVWHADSGVVAHLQNALDIACQGDCPGAKAAALGLTDFVSIAQRNTAASDSSGAAAAPPQLGECRFAPVLPCVATERLCIS